MGRLVTVSEIDDILKMMDKDKSLGPHGWTVEYFRNLFDIMDQDILDIVEES